MWMRDDVIADQRHWTPVLVCFCPENIPRRRWCTREKSSVLISFQTMLQIFAWTTVISHWLGFFWVTRILSFNSHLHRVDFRPLEMSVCAHVITPLDNKWYLDIPRSTSSLSTCGFPQSGVNNQLQRAYKRRRDRAMLWWFPGRLQCK